MALNMQDGQWPVWVPPADAAQKITDGYGHLACFVSVTSLTGLPGLSPVERATRPGPSSDLAGMNRTVAEELYRQLRECRVRYDRAPWHPGRGQRLRDPGWVLAPRGSATCIDFALLYAAMCLNERLAPYLILLRGSRAHAVVAVDLKRSADAPHQTEVPRWARMEQTGVFRVIDREALVRDSRLLLVDPTCCSAPDSRNFEESVDEATAAVRDETYKHSHAIDVALRQFNEDHQLGRPNSRGALLQPLPMPLSPIRAFSSRKDLVAELTGRSGTIVVLGPQGVGKSELARHAAANVDRGRGWFLGATNKAALINSLAAAELYERGWQLKDLELADRDAFGRAALTRLAGRDAPWAVVIDNADRGPAELRGWLAEPDPVAGQLLIVTTTNPDWRDSGFEVLDVHPLLPTEVTDLLEHPKLVELAAGRPLVINAFVALRRFLELSSEELANELKALGDIDEPTTGPRAFWALLRDVPRAPAGMVELASILAWLPPDRMPLEVLAAIIPGSDQAIETLAEAGLVNRLEGYEAAVTLHRLFGHVIRDDLQARRADTSTVIRLLSVPEARNLLTREADAETTAALAASLYGGNPPATSGFDERELGVALWALGTMQETHETTRVSGLTFGQALDHLDQADQRNYPLIADCLHGQAREVNQHHVKDPEKVADARANIERAIALRDPNDAGGIGKHQALEGLLRQRYAVNAMPFGSAEQISELHAALEIIENSWAQRRQAMGDGHPLVDRALFNRGGIRIDLAQREPTRAVEYLSVAEKVYTTTLEYRTGTYRDPHPHTAASHYGLALTWYYRALLDPSADTETLLFDATREAFISLDQRRHTDGGRDGDDAVKSAHLLSKITLARCRQVKGSAEIASFMDEVAREFRP